MQQPSPQLQPLTPTPHPERAVYTCKVSEFRGLATRTIGDARLHFTGRSVLCGLMSTGDDGVESDDDVWITPTNDYVLQVSGAGGSIHVVYT